MIRIRIKLINSQLEFKIFNLIIVALSNLATVHVLFLLDMSIVHVVLLYVTKPVPNSTYLHQHREQERIKLCY